MEKKQNVYTSDKIHPKILWIMQNCKNRFRGLRNPKFVETPFENFLRTCFCSVKQVEFYAFRYKVREFFFFFNVATLLQSALFTLQENFFFSLFCVVRVPNQVLPRPSNRYLLSSLFRCFSCILNLLFYWRGFELLKFKMMPTNKGHFDFVPLISFSSAKFWILIFQSRIEKEPLSFHDSLKHSSIKANFSWSLKLFKSHFF